ncbi:MAG: hypothetical protein MJZ07_00520 [Bacteroidales bacterium]|nr:hypothetical protein [Bacteroidales bacterium]
MKRQLVCLVMALCTTALSAQYLDFPELVKPEENVKCEIFIQKEGRGRAQQGMEIHGRYLFSLEDGGHVNIYDFKKHDGKVIGGFQLASSRPDNHANNAEFGIEKKKGASFPLIYISNGKVGSEIEWLCYVESITKKKDVWSSEIAQTIHMDGSNWESKGYTAIFGAPSWLVDRERKFLWVFSAIKRTVKSVTTDPSENKYIATKFRIPSLKEGKDVYLTVDDILDQVIFPFDIWFTQAGCVVDGKIFYGYGVGKQDDSRPSAIRVYDTDKREITARYNIQEQVIWEIEDIRVKKGWMYVNTNNNPKKTKELPVIYKVSLPEGWKLNRK